jgi:hypothetical protein
MYENATRYQQLVAFLTGEQDIVPPGITLEEDRPEFKFLGRTFLMGGHFNVTSIAGQRPGVGLFNFSPNTLGIITRVSFQFNVIAATVFYRFFRGSSLPGGYVAANEQGPTDTRDPRTIVAGSSALKMAQRAAAGASPGTSLAFWEGLFNFGPSNVFVDDDPLIVLAPNTGFIIEAAADQAQQLLGAMRWYERGCRAEELSLG